jgi:hypothetical protein
MARPQQVTIDLTGRDRVRHVAIGAAVTVAVLAYANALANGFALDDGGVIVRNSLVTSPATAWRAFGLPYWPEAIGGGQYRPLGIMSFALDWLVSGGDPRWFHAMNIVWHAIATLLVGLLAAELLAPAAAGIAATLFAVHPVHVEAVSNVVGRLEPMAATFVLAALLLHRRSNLLGVLFFAFAVFSKESAVVLIALVAANDVILERDWRSTLAARRWLYAGYGATTILYAATLFAVFHDSAFHAPARALAGTDTMDRLVLVARVIPHYVRLLVAPLDLSASYAPNVISPRPEPNVMTLLGSLTILLVALAIWAVARRRRWPAMTFALVWIPIAIAPVSNVFFASGILLAERTLYLASVGICLAAGALGERWFASRAAIVAGSAAVLALAFALRTWTRTPAWRDDRAYVLTMLADHPESYEGHLTAARVLKGTNALAEADRELAIARQLFPRDSLVFLERADVADRMQHRELARTLRDSARIARTLPLPAR